MLEMQLLLDFVKKLYSVFGHLSESEMKTMLDFVIKQYQAKE